MSNGNKLIMSKGLTPVIGTILLLVLVIAIIGISFHFISAVITVSGESTEEETKTKIGQFSEIFRIDHTHENKIYIRNLGNRDLSDLNFYADGLKKDPVSDCIDTIESGKTCEFTIPGLEPDKEYEVKIVSPGGNRMTVKVIGVMNNESVSLCGSLNQKYTIYTLTGNINSAGGCFNIENDSITLDCNGYMINYSQVSFGYGIYSDNYTDITVKNCILVQDANREGTHGIYMKNSSNIIIDNNTIMITGSGSRGIHLANSSGNMITNSNITSEGSRGILLDTNSNNNIITSVIIYSYQEGIHVLNSSNNTISLVNVTSINTDPIFVEGSENNIITNSNLDGVGLYAIGIQFSESDNNQVFNTIATSVNKNGIRVRNSNNITITSSILIGIGQDDLWLRSNADNITLINTTYSSEEVDAGSNLERIWYLDVYVNDTSGARVSGATVTGQNVTGEQVFIDITGANGYITRQALIEYRQIGSTKYYHTDYTINAADSGKVDSKTISLTESMEIYLTPV